MEMTVGICEAAPLLGRLVARVIASAGAKPRLFDRVEQLVDAANSRQIQLAGVRGERLPEILPCLDNGSTQLLVWASEVGPDQLELAAADERVNHLFGLRYPDGPPRSWELLSTTRRRASGQPPPLGAELSWGAEVARFTPATSADRDAVVAEVARLVRALGGRRLADGLAEVAHELLMNAMYDAPVDGEGRPRFAHDRTAAVELAEGERPTFVFGVDGAKVVLSVSDPFGRLERGAVFGGLHRALASGTVDDSGGGAGLGLMVIFRACTLLFFDVIPGRMTKVTAVLELDVPQRELRRLPRSVHFARMEG